MLLVGALLSATLVVQPSRAEYLRVPPVLDELKKNTTLAAVGDLITEEESPGEVHKNAKIHAVLTTNVDGGDEST